MRKLNKSAFAAAVAAGLVGVYGKASAQAVIGNFEAPFVGSGQTAPANIQPAGPSGMLNAVGADGWVDWQNTAVYSQSTIGATNGSHSLEIQTPNGGPYGSFVQDLAISLNATGHVADFLTSGVVAMDVTWTKDEFNGYTNPPAWGSAIDQMALNASNNGVSPISGFLTVGNSAGHASTDSGRPAGDQYNGYRDPSWFVPTAQNPNPANTITATLTWDMSAFVDGNPSNGEVTAASASNNAGFINFIFATNFDSADEDPNQIAWYIDNIRLLPRVVSSGWQGGAPDPNNNSAIGGAAANNWYASLNWTNGVPGVKDSVATLGSGAGSGAQTVNTNSAVVLGGLNFDNTGGWTVGGTGTFTMSATSNAASITVLSGNHSLSNPMQFASATTITVPSGSTLTLSGLQSTTAGLSKSGTGALSVNTVRAASLNVNSGTVGVMISGGVGGTSQVGNLTMGGSAALDMGNHDLDVANTPQSMILNLVKTAYHNGAWNQPGLTSSAAAASGAHPTALAVVHAADYMAITGSSTLNGLPILGSDTIVKYALAGDTNLSGSVNTSDFTMMATSFGSTSAGWIQGDFNYDGVVNALDFNAIATNFGQSLPPLSAVSLGSVVPEPSGLLAAAIVGFVWRRRRMARRS
jgi:hypothetical protein